MFRCLKCGCSRTDVGGSLSCALCGAACGLRTEQCYITDDTKAKLLAHAEDLKDFGLTLEEHESLSKDAKTTIAVTAALVRARKEGRVGGRPKVVVSANNIRKLADQGLSAVQIGAQLGCSRMTVARRLSQNQSV